MLAINREWKGFNKRIQDRREFRDRREFIRYAPGVERLDRRGLGNRRKVKGCWDTAYLN